MAGRGAVWRPNQLATLLASCEVDQFSYGPSDVSLLLPAGVYRPDEWTRQLLIGVERQLRSSAGWPAQTVEVGVGSGVVPISIAKMLGCAFTEHYLGLDRSYVACEAARLNFAINRTDLNYSLFGGGNLLDPLPRAFATSIDLVIANLPQIPARQKGASINDYYRPSRGRRGSRTETQLDRYGLGLLYDLLCGANRTLTTAGVVVMTVAGRCGGAAIDSLFAACDMQYTILHTARLRQDPHTTLDSLVANERHHGLRYTFFPWYDANETITAVDAQRLITRGSDAYFDLHVVLAERLTA